MKHLKIENKIAQYSIDGEEWKNIEDIDRKELVSLIRSALAEGFDMDNPQGNEIVNGAQKIIYENIFGKLLEINNCREEFLEECNSRYKEAIEKYR